MKTLPQGEIRPSSPFHARAELWARQVFPSAADEQATVTLPLFRLVNVLSDAMAEIAIPKTARQPHPDLRPRAAQIAIHAFPQVDDDKTRVAMPLSRLIDLLAQAMAAAR